MQVSVAVKACVPLGSQGIEHQTTFVAFDGVLADDFVIAFSAKGPQGAVPLVRLHSECVTGDTFGSTRCDCGPQLQYAISTIAEMGGCIVYLRQEGRGIGLKAKLRAYNLQDAGEDTYSANHRLGYADDCRDYGVAAAMLKSLGYNRLRLLSNNPKKAAQLRVCGIEVVEMVAVPTFLTAYNERYLRTKAEKGGHLFSITPPI